MSCKYCGLGELVCGDTDFLLCSNCGTVQDLNIFQHHYGGILGPQGTFVCLDTASSRTNYSYKERKLFQSNNIIDDITSRLNFTDAYKEEVKHIIDVVTEEETGAYGGNILAFVAELNGVKVKIEDVAAELSMVVHTCKKRHNELLETVVKVAQKLPCSKVVNAKNILKNAQFVIQYMEMKSMANIGAKRIGCKSGGLYLDDAVGKCFSREVEYGIDAVTIENDLQYYHGGVENENDDS
ncbi:hypothetical protein Ancab_005415 [Ancistrocladus abbreviatus]